MEKASFFEDVYEVVKQIPKGRVTSYGAIAHYLGAKSGARMVGWAMNASFTHSEYVPAHRVVNSKGLLSGKHHFSSPNEMEDRLKEEGIKVKNDQIIAFDKYFWNPSTELAL
ncbi:MAG: MGMT family protein [Bacteroidota bacterium]